jgi:tetratricopeptide (TPR) repeat protein
MPVEALAALRAMDLRGRVFPSFAFGTYIAYAGWPALTTYVDSRLEVFGGEFLRTYAGALASAGEFRAIAARDPFDLALLAWQTDRVDGPLAVLAADTDWTLVYFDDVALLWARRLPGREALIAERGYRALDPVRFVGERRFAPGASPQAVEREARRAVAEAPRRAARPALNALARIALAQALHEQGRDAEAQAELVATLAAEPVPTTAYLMLGAMLSELGDREHARRALAELAARAPDLPGMR